MIDGRCIEGDSLDITFKKGDFLAKTNKGLENKKEDEAEGMFIVSKANKRKIVLEQIDCGHTHWKGDSTGSIREPDKNCRSKCIYFGVCPIRDYLLLLKSGFE